MVGGQQVWCGPGILHLQKTINVAEKVHCSQPSKNSSAQGRAASVKKGVRAEKAWRLSRQQPPDRLRAST